MVSSKASTVADYLAELPDERAGVIATLRDLVNEVLPDGYVEVMRWGMINWEIPLELSGPTYNDQPHSYVALAAQKNVYSLYLNCTACSPERTGRLQQAAIANGHKLDMGKSCIRFKRIEQLPLDAIREEIGSASPADFLSAIEKAKQSGC